MQVILDFCEADDRTCDQLWEHAKVCRKIQKSVCNLVFSPIDVNHIGGSLKCIEADSKRQSEIRRLQDGRMRNAIDHTYKEIQVLEHK